jgi:hypothetical protein
MEHMSSRTSRFKCSLCTKDFISSLELEWHVDTEHVVPEVIFKCLKCTFTSTSNKELESHNVLVHAFPCTICKEVFANEDVLNLHSLQVHQDNNDESLPAMEPGYRSSTATNGFKCDRCDQLFGSETYFTKHICNPQQIPPTVFCDQCDFKSTSVKDFVSHLLEVHKHYHGTYKCSFCDFEAIGNPNFFFIFLLVRL